MQDLSKLLKVLLDKKIEFILVVGFAAVVHGLTLVTEDVDIWMSISEDSLSELRNALKNLNPWHRMNRKVKLSFLEFKKNRDNLKD